MLIGDGFAASGWLVNPLPGMEAALPGRRTAGKLERIGSRPTRTVEIDESMPDLRPRGLPLMGNEIEAIEERERLASALECRIDCEWTRRVREELWRRRMEDPFDGFEGR